MSMEWDYVAVKNWDGLQLLLDQGRFKKLNSDLYKLAEGCDECPNFDVNDGVISQRRIGAFLDAAQDIEQHCAPELREAWSSVFFNRERPRESWQSVWRDYLTSIQELRLPKDLPDAHTFCRLSSALSPATVKRLAEWTFQIKVNDYASAFRPKPDNHYRYFEDWDDFELMVRYWFEILQRTAKCGCGLLTFVL